MLQFISMQGIKLFLFYFRPPSPNNEQNEQESQKGGDQEPEKMPENMCDFSILVNKVGAKQGVLFDAVTMEASVSIPKFINH